MLKEVGLVRRPVMRLAMVDKMFKLENSGLVISYLQGVPKKALSELLDLAVGACLNPFYNPARVSSSTGTHNTLC